MPHTLLLRLPAPGQEHTEWLSIDETGSLATTRQRGPLSLAAAIARTARVIVLAPAGQILLAQPELPPGNAAKLARAVPFALEEQLTEDIDQMFFALGRRRANGRTPVAGVSRSVMQGWLSELGAAGIEPVAVYADISLVPENPGQTVLWLEQSRLTVRRPGALPFAVDLTPASEALVVAGVIPDPLAEPDDTRLPENVLLYASREDWLAVQPEIEALADQFESLKVQLFPDGPLPWLAQSLPAPDAVNLLQGEFARSSGHGERWRPWRLPALLAAGLLVTHAAAAALQIHRANRESAALDTQIAQLFSQIMPNAPALNPRSQMQSQLDRIRRSGPSAQYFLRSLQTLSAAVASMPKVQVDAFSYREQALDLKLTAPSLGALSQLSQALGSQGLSADIQSSTPVEAGVEAHLQVRAAGAKAKR